MKINIYDSLPQTLHIQKKLLEKKDRDENNLDELSKM
jgi:hypothetical protein